MRILLATIVVGLCALAGLGLSVSALSSGATASTGAAAFAPVNANGVVYAPLQLAPGPDNPGGQYTFVTTPCHPWACDGS